MSCNVYGAQWKPGTEPGAPRTRMYHRPLSRHSPGNGEQQPSRQTVTEPVAPAVTVVQEPRVQLVPPVLVWFEQSS